MLLCNNTHYIISREIFQYNLFLLSAVHNILNFTYINFISETLYLNYLNTKKNLKKFHYLYFAARRHAKQQIVRW